MKTLFCWVLVLAGAHLFAQNSQARVIDFTGSVEIKAGGQADWIPAAPGMAIGRDTVVSTGFNSTARISLGNSVLTVRPLTRLTVAEIAQRGGDEAVDLYLETGRVRAEVSPPSGGKTDFTVRSPSITASVRGTVFEFDTRRIQVESGRVLFTNANRQAVYVDGGERSYIDEAQNRPVPPFEAEAASLRPVLPGLIDTVRNDAGTAPVVSHPLGGNADVEAGFEWP
ncbi:MAG: FecR family protein [Treponema sp.]|jgi:hypothetical protein|nr:FecR family protein [Treponema sp.]